MTQKDTNESLTSNPDTGYYWAFYKGSPAGDVVYYHNGSVYNIWEAKWEPMSEGRWRLGAKVCPVDHTTQDSP